MAESSPDIVESDRAFSDDLRKPNVTAQHVADLANVSRSAVSRCFSGAGKVSKDKRQRILAAAEELGYRPNAIARSLTGQKNDLVALITTEHLSQRSNEHLSALTLRLAEVGKRALVIPVGDDTSIDESSLRALDYKVDAIVIMGGSVSDRIVGALRAARVPLLLFGREHVGETAIGVSCDNERGGEMAARFLARTGCRRFAYIGKKARTHSDRSRRLGFKHTLEELGLALHGEEEDETTYEGGRRAASKLFASAKAPDALFCFNDIMAYGALRAARDFKLSVPDDLAVIGFDNQPMSAWPEFNLSTVECDPDKLALLATRQVLAALTGAKLARRTYYLAPELVIRGTTS